MSCATDRSHLQDEVASKQLMVTELGTGFFEMKPNVVRSSEVNTSAPPIMRITSASNVVVNKFCEGLSFP